MLRKLSLKLFAILLLTAFICGISAVPALAITISGTVITISKSGEEQSVGGATVTLFNRTGKIDQVTRDDNGALSITLPGDQLLDVYFLTTKDTHVDTYMQFFSFLEDEEEFEAPILPTQETQDVIASVTEGDHPVDETKGIIAGAVELLFDDALTAVAAGVSSQRSRHRSPRGRIGCPEAHHLRTIPCP